MRRTLLLVALALAAPLRSAAQAPACPQPLASLAVPPLSYAEVDAAPFERRVFVYVPEVKAGGSAGFQPFQAWVVEGVYGRPFVQSSGRLEAPAFERLRRSQNVRATPIAVARGDGSEWAPLSIRRTRYSVQVLKVNPRSARVELRVCR